MEIIEKQEDAAEKAEEAKHEGTEQATEQAVEEAKRKEADEKFKALIKSYLSKEDAEKSFADNRIKTMQLTVIRNKWNAQIEALQQQISEVRQRINALDNEMYSIQLADAVTFRRTLNEKPADEEAK